VATESTLSYLDQYCERAGQTGIFAEPLNAVTNLAFILAAFLAWRYWRRAGQVNAAQSLDIVVLILLLAVIGLGSGAWHVFANSHTLLMDVIPIVLFMNVFLVAAAIRILGLRWWGALLLFVLFQVLNVASEMFLPREMLNGTIMYIPAYSLLVGIVARSAMLRHPARTFLSYGLGVWTFSLVFRTIDHEVCGFFPLGTHFLWHLLNAVVLSLLLRALIRAQVTSPTLQK
jgi:Ceramidase